MDNIVGIDEMTIAEVLERWPATAAVFTEFQMACVGCAVADYYSVVDAAQIYGVSLDEFLERLKLAALVTRVE